MGLLYSACAHTGLHKKPIRPLHGATCKGRLNLKDSISAVSVGPLRTGKAKQACRPRLACMPEHERVLHDGGFTPAQGVQHKVTSPWPLQTLQSCPWGSRRRSSVCHLRCRAAHHATVRCQPHPPVGMQPIVPFPLVSRSGLQSSAQHLSKKLRFEWQILCIHHTGKSRDEPAGRCGGRRCWALLLSGLSRLGRSGGCL